MKTLTHGSTFSGIDGFGLAFERAGIQELWRVEIDKDCNAQMAKKRPHVPLIGNGDIRDALKIGLPAVDIISGGFPCQDLSVAGKRAGLAGERSGLYYEFHKIVTKRRPRWVIIENVPGLLSSNQGQDFAIVVGGLTGIIPEVPGGGWGNAGLFRGLVYHVAYRVLDAQFFGVPQRRRRVVIVASLGDGSCAEVLFESESGPGDTAQGGKTGQEITPTIRAGAANDSAGHGARSGDSKDELIIAETLTSTYAKSGGAGAGKDSKPHNIVVMAHGHGNAEVAKCLSSPHTSTGRLDPSAETFLIDPQPLAFTIQSNDGGDHKRKDRPAGGLYVNETDTSLTVGSTDLTAIVDWNADVSPTLGKDSYKPRKSSSGQMVDFSIAQRSGVRRLTPVECERLQGFPDDWTAGQADTVRYRQCGNAIAIPPFEWLGKRIVEVEKRNGRL